MKTIYFLTLGIFLAGFVSKEKSVYDKEKTAIISTRNLYQGKFKSSSISSDQERQKVIIDAGKDLQYAIVDRIIPHWYGTTWDFNGYTAIPKQGTIACGYFVSTVMLHAGFNLNRYKMAQKHSFDEAKLYSCGDKLYDFCNTTKEEFIAKVKDSLAEGLYILALDNHIGFLLIENTSIYFIHSNYRYPSEVVKEQAKESKALEDSRRFILTAVSSNKSILKKWALNERIGD